MSRASQLAKFETRDVGCQKLSWWRSWEQLLMAGFGQYSASRPSLQNTNKEICKGVAGPDSGTKGRGGGPISENKKFDLPENDIM